MSHTHTISLLNGDPRRAQASQPKPPAATKEAVPAPAHPRAELEQGYSAAEIVAEPSHDYGTLRKQFYAVRTLANARRRIPVHLRDSAVKAMRELQACEPASESGAHSTVAMFDDALRMVEQERDTLREQNAQLLGLLLRARAAHAYPAEHTFPYGEIEAAVLEGAE